MKRINDEGLEIICVNLAKYASVCSDLANQFIWMFSNWEDQKSLYAAAVNHSCGIRAITCLVNQVCESCTLCPELQFSRNVESN